MTPRKPVAWSTSPACHPLPGHGPKGWRREEAPPQPSSPPSDSTPARNPKERIGSFQFLNSGKSNECSALKVTPLRAEPVLSETSPLLSKEGFSPLRNTTPPSSPDTLRHQHQQQQEVFSSTHRLFPTQLPRHHHTLTPLLCKALNMNLC